MNTYNQPSSASTSTISNGPHSRSKPRKALPRTPILTKAKLSSSSSMHPPASAGAFSSNAKAFEAKQPYRTSIVPSRQIFMAQPNAPPQPPRSSFLSNDGPFPPRRPIQRSLYATEQVIDPGSMVALSPTSPMTKLHSSAPMANLITPTRAPRQGQPQPQRRGPILVSPPLIQYPIISPLKDFFDHTLRCVYSELSHLQSSCLGVLGRERREKEALRAHFLKMKRERDVAVERARELESSHKCASGGGGSKRPREDASDGESMRIQPPPAPCVQLSEHRRAEHVAPDRDAYEFTRPERSSTGSPSPPPPPISGRRLYFSPPRDTSPSLTRPLVLTSETASPPPPQPGVDPNSQLDSLTSHEPSPDGGDRIKLLSPFHSSDEDDELVYPPIKRRRVSAFSESSDHSNVTLIGVQDPGSSSNLKTEPVTPTASHESDDDDDWGECDMDLESDSDSEENTVPHSSSEEAVVKEERCDEEEDDALLGELPLSGSSISTAVPDGQESQSSKEQFPPLNLHDLTQMYAQYEGKVYCRLCCSRKADAQWSCDSPLPTMDARCLNLDVLMEHCTSQHPVAYSDAAGLTLHQVFKLKRMLEVNKAARMGAAA